MDPTDDLSARVLLKHILSTETPRTPVTRSTAKAQATAATRRVSRKGDKDADAQTPQGILRRSLRHKIRENLTRKSLPASKRRTASFVLKQTNTPAPASMLFDDEDTPRHVLMNILHTEPARSPVVHKKMESEEPQPSSSDATITSKRPSMELSGLDLPDITTGNIASTVRGLSRKRRHQSLNVTAFESRLKDGNDDAAKNEEYLSDQSSLSLTSSTSLNLKTPFVDVRTEKRGLQRRVSNRRKITEEEFGAAVNKRQTRGQHISVAQGPSDTAYSEGFTLGLSKLSEPDITTDIVHCNTALYDQPEALTSNLSIIATQDKPTVMASKLQRQMMEVEQDQPVEADQNKQEEERSMYQFLTEEGLVADSQNLFQCDDVAETQEEEEALGQAEDAAAILKSEEEESIAESQNSAWDDVVKLDEQENRLESRTEEDATTDSQNEEAGAVDSQTEDDGDEELEVEPVEDAAARSPSEEEEVQNSQSEEDGAVDSQIEDDDEEVDVQPVEDAAARSRSEEEDDAPNSRSEEDGAVDSQIEDDDEEVDVHPVEDAAARSPSEEEDDGAVDSQIEEDKEGEEVDLQLDEDAAARSQSEEEEVTPDSQTEEEDVQIDPQTKELGAVQSQSEEEEDVAESQRDEENPTESSLADSQAEDEDDRELEGKGGMELSERQEQDLGRLSCRARSSGGRVMPVTEAGSDMADPLESGWSGRRSEAHGATGVNNSTTMGSRHQIEQAGSSTQWQTDASRTEPGADKENSFRLSIEDSEHIGDSPPEEEAAEQQEREFTEGEDSEDSEEVPSKTPAFVRVRRRFSQPDPPASPVLKNVQTSTTDGPLPAKPKQRRKRTKAGKSEGGLPKGYLMSVFRHFAKTKVSADVYPVLKDIMDKYFDRLAEDLETYVAHAKRKTVEVEDAELLLKRQGYVNDKVPVEVLIEKYLRMDQRKLLIPIATRGNVVIPVKKR